jgi:hypothetical protein
LLKETEIAFQAHRDSVEKDDSKPKRFKGRLFNILPMKNGFTTSFVPISALFFLSVVKKLNLSDHNGDGRNTDKRTIWNKFCNMNLVETKKRKFDESITTDGYSVSVLISSKMSINTTSGPTDSTIDHVRESIRKTESAIRYGGIDPGFSDVVTCSFDDGATVSYGSSRYYEKAKIKHSMRNTNKFNYQKKDMTDSLLSVGGSRTASVSKMEDYLKTYLSVNRELIRDRMVQKYRKMRFLRHVSKQSAVKEIVDLLVGKEINNTCTVIGFGDWSGGSQSIISRKHSGPIQQIKHEIGKRKNAIITSIDEFRTSKLDSNDWSVLVNMKAKTTIRKSRRRGGENIEMRNQKVHTVLHCKSSEGKNSISCKKTTWNRDDNASKNILMLLRMEIKGYDRPEPFRRSGYKKIKTMHGSEAAGTHHATVVVATPENAVILIPPEKGPQ